MRLIFVILFTQTLLSLSAQTITIKDAETKQPLEFVILIDSINNISASSNSNGQIDIGRFSNTEEILLRYLGYKKTTLLYEDLVKQKVILLESKPFSLNPIIVSANRWKQNKKEVPSKISSISSKDFEFQNPQTAADLLASSGEVFIQKSQQGGGSPMIRGFSANRLLYSVDGVRMNTAIFRSGNLQNVISLDPFTMENTEVLFGPGSVIYGSDAIGGVMSFNTLTPKLSLNDTVSISGKAAVRFASANNEQTIHLDINVGAKKWAFISSITQSDYDDLRMGNNGPNEYKRNFIVERREGEDLIIENNRPNLQAPSFYSQINLMQKIRFKPNENWDVNYGFHFSESTDFDRYDRLIQLNNNLPRYAEWKYGPQKWMMNTLDIKHSKKTKLYDQFSLKLAYQQFDESRINRNFNDSIRFERKEKVHAYSINLDFTKKLDNNHQFFYGIEGILNQVNSTGEYEDIITLSKKPIQSRYPNSDWNSYAVYLTEQFRLNEKLILHSGLRYNWYSLNSTFDTSLFSLPYKTASLNNAALNGNLGAVYQSTDKLIFSLNLSSGFRAPNVDDIGKVFDSEPTAIVVPNPQLKEEYAYNADFNVTKVFGDLLKLDFTLFYTYLNDALVRRNFTLNNQDSIMYEGVLSQVQAIQNAAESYVYGTQLSIEIKLNKSFTFSSQLNYQKGEEELDDGSITAPRHAAPTFGISRFNFQKGKTRIQLFAEYSKSIDFEDLNIGERNKPHIYAEDKNGNPHSPAWYTLNLRGSYSINKKITANIGLENITDQRYKAYSSGIAAPGRNFKFSLSGTF